MSSSSREAHPVAFPELKSNLINRPLRPFVGLCQPEFFTILVKQSAFPVHHFLITNFSNSAHLRRFPKQNPIKPLRNTTEQQRTVSMIGMEQWLVALPHLIK
jgi:hypothetical protein